MMNRCLTMSMIREQRMAKDLTQLVMPQQVMPQELMILQRACCRTELVVERFQRGSAPACSAPERWLRRRTKWFP